MPLFGGNQRAARRSWSTLPALLATRGTMKPSKVLIERCSSYDPEALSTALGKFARLFDTIVRPGDRVVLKPNWIAPHHRYRHDEWESVITHPSFISAVLREVVQRLDRRGSVIITDGPQTDSSFASIMSHMAVEDWQRIAAQHGIDFAVLDLRDMEWREVGDVIFDRRKLPGDPLGSVEFNLGDFSNFHGHSPSSRGYYGADYDIAETTAAHTNGNHRYRVSRTVISADLFINLPKLKTHKKAGVTCSLKNLVGINTYKNFLPHHTEGTPMMGGDQFPSDSWGSTSEVLLLERFKRLLLRYKRYGRVFIPLKRAGRLIFGETKQKIRSGNWYGNDTLWRMILDLNALLLYGKPDGAFREPAFTEQKRYLSIIDGVIAGEGNGPEAPDPFPAGVILGGLNPLSVDCAAVKLMGFDYQKIPSLKHGFDARHFPLCDCTYNEIDVASTSLAEFNGRLLDVPSSACFHFRPHFGWRGHIEAPEPVAS